MAWKIVIVVLAALCLFIPSCYPELSVQQYNKLKDDLTQMDEQRTELAQDLNMMTAELQQIKTQNTEVKAYIDFLVQLISTQNTESLLSGEFDTNALIKAKDELIASSDQLQDQKITYYLSLISPDNEAETVAAYYKAIEYCLKNVKQLLAANAENTTSTVNN